MKKALRILSQSGTETEDYGSSASVHAGVLVVADAATGDTALSWALELVRHLVALGAEVEVSGHTVSNEAAHREALRQRFTEQGAATVRLDARLAALCNSLSPERSGQVSLLVGGPALARVEGGVRIVLRTPQLGPSGASAAESLERDADLVLGSSRGVFAQYYARRILGIE